MSDTLSTVAAAKRARVADRTIRHWLRAGLVEHERDPQGRRLVVRASLDAHLAAKGIIPADPAEAEEQAGSSGNDPAAVPGLPELVAELALLRRENAQLEWRNGHLSALLDEERRKPKLLGAGPPALPEPKPPDPPDDPAPPEGLWARVVRWWRGGP